MSTIHYPSTEQRTSTGRGSIKELLLPIFVQVGTAAESLRADSLGIVAHGADRYLLPRFVFRGHASSEPMLKLAIFAGIHGDEPAGILACIDFLRVLEAQPHLGRGYEIRVYPLCNPTGYEDGTRESRSGCDLNRAFWKTTAEPEVRLLEEELRTQHFDGIVSLHSDDTSDGVYAFIGGATLTEHLLKPALAAAEQALPINGSTVIDGFHAIEGIIRSGYGGMLTAPPGSHPAPFEIVLESPSGAPVALQRQALVLALTEIVRHHRRLISYAANI